MKVLAGCFVEIDAAKMMVEILKVVIVPIATGGFVHWLFRGLFKKHKAVCDRVLSVLSMTVICFTMLALTAPSRSTFASAGVLIIVAAIVHNTIGYVSGYWLTRLVGRFAHLGETEARTVALEVGHDVAAEEGPVHEVAAGKVAPAVRGVHIGRIGGGVLAEEVIGALELAQAVGVGDGPAVGCHM